MYKLFKRVLIITILMVGIANIASAQVFTLTSFTGAKKAVTVSPISNKGEVSIMSLKDTIRFVDVYTIEKATLLNPDFLMVTCSVRAGSGMRLEKTVIVCAKGDHVYEALRISSFFKEDFLDFSKPVQGPMKVSLKTIYRAGLDLIEDQANNYKLHVKIHAERKSIIRAADNYSYNHAVSLNFNTSQNVFYNGEEYLAQSFSIFSIKTNAESKRYIKGTFPIVKLGDYKYYYIKGEWYEFTSPSQLNN